MFTENLLGVHAQVSFCDAEKTLKTIEPFAWDNFAWELTPKVVRHFKIWSVVAIRKAFSEVLYEGTLSWLKESWSCRTSPHD